VVVISVVIRIDQSQSNILLVFGCDWWILRTTLMQLYRLDASNLGQTSFPESAERSRRFCSRNNFVRDDGPVDHRRDSPASIFRFDYLSRARCSPLTADLRAFTRSVQTISAPRFIESHKLALASALAANFRR